TVRTERRFAQSVGAEGLRLACNTGIADVGRAGWRAPVDGEPCKLLGVGGVAAHRCRGPTIQLVTSDRRSRFCLHSDGGAEVAPAPHDPVAKIAPLPIVARERRVEIIAF